MLWEDVPAAVHQVYLRRWPKLHINAHLRSPSSPSRRHKDAVPNDALPETCLDWDGLGTVPDSAWRTLVTKGCRSKQGRSHEKRAAPFYMKFSMSCNKLHEARDVWLCTAVPATMSMCYCMHKVPTVRSDVQGVASWMT